MDRTCTYKPKLCHLLTSKQPHTKKTHKLTSCINPFKNLQILFIKTLHFYNLSFRNPRKLCKKETIFAFFNLPQIQLLLLVPIPPNHLQNKPWEDVYQAKMSRSSQKLKTWDFPIISISGVVCHSTKLACFCQSSQRQSFDRASSNNILLCRK